MVFHHPIWKICASPIGSFFQVGVKNLRKKCHYHLATTNFPGSTSTSASAVPEAGVVTSRTSVSSSSNSREVSDWRACDNRRGRPLPYFFTGTRDDLGNLKLIETGKKISWNCKTEKKQLKIQVWEKTQKGCRIFRLKLFGNIEPLVIS